MDPSAVHADLHTHTRCSDGRLAPEALVKTAADWGVRVLAVTDHDTTEGLADAEAAAQARGLTFVPGIELSVTEEDDEVHLLAYGIDPVHPALQDHLQAFRKARRERAWTMVDRLRDHGLTVDDEELAAEIESTHAVGRPHVAAALVRAGHVETPREAFERYIGRDGPGYVAKPTVPAATALDLVHRAGGLAVLAHPGHWTSGRRIRRLVDRGLDGIEVVHPSHDASLRRYYERLADGYDLIATGGSDHHGRAGRDGQLGHFGLSKQQWERCRARLA
jgi:Predicted metal-dependent phosphoesterases (PHP family)